MERRTQEKKGGPPAYYNSNGSTFNQYVGGGTSYDANGNLLNDTFNTYTWDADGNIATVNGTTNTYDALGKVVETSAGPTQFVYLPGGTQPFATMSNYQSYLKVFAPAPGGSMIFTANGSWGVLSYHRHTDWLGSSRFATTPAETVYSDGAYAPFGEPYASSGTTDLEFGGNPQDVSAIEGATAGDAYDTLNRKYSAAQSRWVSPDPAGMGAVDPGNPQSWNRYAYVLNNPLSAVDPLGLDCVYDDGDGTVDTKFGDCYSPTDNGYYVDCDGCLFDSSGNALVPTLDPATGALYYPGAADANGNPVTILGFAAPLGLQAEIVNALLTDSSNDAANNGPMDWVIEDYSLLRLKQTWWKWGLGYGAKVGAVKLFNLSGTTVGYLGGLSTLMMLGSTMIDATSPGMPLAPGPPAPPDPCMGQFMGLNWVPGANGTTVGVPACQ